MGAKLSHKSPFIMLSGLWNSMDIEDTFFKMPGAVKNLKYRLSLVNEQTLGKGKAHTWLPGTVLVGRVLGVETITPTTFLDLIVWNQNVYFGLTKILTRSILSHSLGS